MIAASVVSEQQIDNKVTVCEDSYFYKEEISFIKYVKPEV
jgi:hypothetical protein